ncbi:protein of unknown function [Maridesulfovibrio ferrireducens]|uniref:Flavinylation-associated cytochrome domain-containing protein n=1 Tax=Maridesulfovibrio ferrireducens TaxID=246191 RepID=A0A1G9AXG4_9BACT|nr:DUF4405 domain-containing protein [Maridesulfovibrio ferrireducens]SDK31927.1 protein of unknown function [Maridesulfovibrio ferrireducens]
MFRKITSLISFFAIIVMSLTSVILYLVPQGRVAYWADWKFLWLTKEQWGDIHICTGVLFLFVSILHIWLNWKPITAYLKKKAAAATFSSTAFFISIFITLYVVVGTLAGLPPMKQVLEFSTHLKTQGEIKYGVPPYGHAELSPLSVFCKRMELDIDKAVASIKAAGIEIKNPAQSIKEIAHKAGLTPKELHEIILKDQPNQAANIKSGAPINKSGINQNSGNIKGAGMHNGAGTGLGQMTLEQYCERQNLDLNTALGILREKGAVVDKSTTIRDIAGMLEMTSPRQIGILLHP